MKVPAATIALCGFVISATACAPTADQSPAADEAAATEADVEALKALEETVVAAFKAGEVDPMAALYPEDVVVLAPNQPALVGENAVLAWLQGFFDQFTVDEFTSPVEEVVVAGA
jgi:ketosteroid isomerase-like protein